MKIRTKLLLLITVLVIPLFFNLLVLGYLVWTVTQSVQTIQEVSVRQQAVTLRMQAQLRDAEAALYRYQIEGTAGFAQQFDTLLSNFEQEVAAFRSLATSEEEQLWAGELAQAHQEAIALGGELIDLRDTQTADLQQLENLHHQTGLLLTKVRLSRSSNDAAYQTSVSGMQTDLREMLLAVTAYLAAPNPVERIRFSDATLTFRFHHGQFNVVLSSFQERRWAAELKRDFEQIDALGLSLINGRAQQQEKFSQFAANLSQAGQQVIVGEIQPHATNNLNQAQIRLSSTLTFAITWSIITSLVAVVIALIMAIPNLRQITSSVNTLLAGADRVAAGDLTQPVHVTSNDELYQLGQTFNTMMDGLATRESRLQRRISELETLREVNLQLTSVLDLGYVFQTIVKSTRKLVDASEAHIFLRDEETGDTMLQASDWRNAPRSNKPRTPRDDGLVMTALRTKEIQILNNAARFPRYTDPNTHTYGFRASAAYPLTLNNRVLGVFHVALDDRDQFREGELRVLGLIADQAAVALENAQLYQSVAEKETRLNNLLQLLTVVQEEERRLVGLDLHDGLTQILLSANLHFNTASLLLKNIDPSSKTEFVMGQTRLQEAIEEVRWVISELRPTELEDLGLVDGLRQYVIKVAQTAGWRATFLADFKQLEVSPALETAVFRITQEALSNARKYAKTDRIEVKLEVIDNNLIVVVQDWGRGFDITRTEGSMDRLGLLGMQERAELLGGKLTLDSVIGQGTTIKVCIPLDNTTVIQTPQVYNG